MPRTVIVSAILLRSVDYSDADRIVTLLTDRFGKAGFIARGARRSKKRFSGALQPFCLLSAEVAPSTTQLGTLVQAQVTRSFPRILTDLARMGVGFAALELVRELTAEHEPENVVFTTAAALFDALDAQQSAPESLLLCFEMRLLTLLGFAPQLAQCGLCGKRAAPSQAGQFDPRLGHLVCTGCGGAAHRLAGRVRAQLMLAMGPDWLSAASEPWREGELAPTRQTLLTFVELRIGHPLLAASLLAVSPKEPKDE